MAKKIVVINPTTNEQVPFLRGVLVQSLTAIGLSFEDAYAAAQRVRDALDNTDTIATTQLRECVAQELEQHFDTRLRQAYEAGREHDREIMVRQQGRDSPFSVAYLTRHLEACAVEHDDALEGARTVHEILRARGDPEIHHLDLRRLIHETLREKCCVEAANRFLSRCLFDDSGEPLIILIGGTTGSGKSTITADLAYRLNIVRTQSTDMMREIIRCYLVPHVAPTLGYSSFKAWRGLPEVEPGNAQPGKDSPVIRGFLSQFGTVKVALEATVDRAVKERHHLIVDGVHVLPTQLDLANARDKAMVVPFVLAVTTIGRLTNQLARRSREQPERSSSRHQDLLASIWELQNFFVDQAEKGGIPVIGNWTVEETVREILREVMIRISDRFPPDEAAIGRGSRKRP